MNQEFLLKSTFILLLLFVMLNKYIIFDPSENYVNMFFKTSNISIIIEIDSFDYSYVSQAWGRVLSKIPFKVRTIYFYVHRHNTYLQNSKKKIEYLKKEEQMLKKLENMSFPRIVISDLPDNGYLPLMISSYTDDMYPLQTICYIDARNINHKRHIWNLLSNSQNNVLAKWIEDAYKMHLEDPSLASVFGFHTKVDLNNSENNMIKKIVGCDLVMVKEKIVRELLYYTKCSLGSPSPFLALSMIDDQKVHNSFKLIQNQFIQKVNFFPFSKPNHFSLSTHINEAFQCPSTLKGKSDNITFSVFIPCFKRNYFKLTLTRLSNETMQPEYYVLIQNRYYIDIDVENELQNYLRANPRPIYKIWMVNYNSFFVLPNLVTSLLNTDFVIRLDDDHIPDSDNRIHDSGSPIHFEGNRPVFDSHMHDSYDLMKTAVTSAFSENLNHDTILGDRPSVLNIVVGNFVNSDSIRISCRNPYVDYVASPYVYRPIQMKLAGRLKPFFLSGGEDAHFGLSASILCDTFSRHLKFKIKDFSADSKGHANDDEIRNNVMSIEKIFDGELIHNVYAYYVKIGLKSKCWSNFVLDPRDKINGSVYSHQSFF